MNDARIDALPERFRIEDGCLFVDGQRQSAVEQTADGKSSQSNIQERMLAQLSDCVYRDAYAMLPTANATATSNLEPVSSQAEMSFGISPEVPSGFQPEKLIGSDDEFIDAVIAAHASSERWDAGWTLDAVAASGHVSVIRDADWRYAAPGEYRVDPAGRGLVPGARIALLARAFDLESQVGSIYLHGEVQADRSSTAWLGRFYFNASSDVTVELVRHLTTLLNQCQLPYTIKCPALVQLCSRVDSVVLYVAIPHCDYICRLLNGLRREHGSLFDRLDSATPLFSKPLAPGLGFAEDPGNGHSFGSHRAGLVAQALMSWTAPFDSERQLAQHLHTEGSQQERALQEALDTKDRRSESGTKTSAWREHLARTFVAAGIDFAQPWLSPGSIDRFSIDGKAPLDSHAYRFSQLPDHATRSLLAESTITESTDPITTEL